MNRARPELVSARVVFTQQGFYFPRNSCSPLLLSLPLVTSSLSALLLLLFSAQFWFDPSQLLRYVLIARLGFGLSAKVCFSRRWVYLLEQAGSSARFLQPCLSVVRFFELLVQVSISALILSYRIKKVEVSLF
jgi:hypothetical protein